jgi:hypothetical protein
MAIRQQGEEIHKDVITPFRAFFQNVNLFFHKANQDAKLATRKQEMINQSKD